MSASSSLQLRRQLPPFGLYIAGALALLGNAITTVALPWFVLSLTGIACPESYRHLQRRTGD